MRKARRAAAGERAAQVLPCFVIISVCCLLGCGSATISGQREIGAAPPATPTEVYVTDFDLDAQNIRSEPGLLPPPPPPPGPLGNLLPRPPGAPKDPAIRARELIDLMSTTLVQDLVKAGLNARRLTPAEPPPANGWLVRGVFTQVGEGHRLVRAVIGFGAGQTELQLAVAIDDLAQGAPKPLYELDTTAASGKLPGAVITMNPYVAAARFVLAGHDLEQNVKRTAAKIATDLASRVGGQPEPTR
jgi:Domain of unknown function (DUF4410)